MGVQLGGGMMRLAMIVSAGVLAGTATASAQTPLERGKYLMNSIVACGNCHTPQTPQGPVPGKELAGGTRFEEGFGVAYAPNITPDPETGIGKWSDGDIKKAITTGVRPDGERLKPPMAYGYYKNIT